MIGDGTTVSLLRRPRMSTLTGIVMVGDVMADHMLPLTILDATLAVSTATVMIGVKEADILMASVTIVVTPSTGGLDHGVLAGRAPPSIIPPTATGHLLGLHEVVVLCTTQIHVLVAHPRVLD